jgi:hypothetical protein
VDGEVWLRDYRALLTGLALLEYCIGMGLSLAEAMTKHSVVSLIKTGIQKCDGYHNQTNSHFATLSLLYCRKASEPKYARMKGHHSNKQIDDLKAHAKAWHESAAGKDFDRGKVPEELKTVDGIFSDNSCRTINKKAFARAYQQVLTCPYAICALHVCPAVPALHHALLSYALQHVNVLLCTCKGQDHVRSERIHACSSDPCMRKRCCLSMCCPVPALQHTLYSYETWVIMCFCALRHSSLCFALMHSMAYRCVRLGLQMTGAGTGPPRRPRIPATSNEVILTPRQLKLLTDRQAKTASTVS